MNTKSILETVHDTAKGLHDAEVMDVQTMREFDVLCTKPTDSGPIHRSRDTGQAR